MDAMTIETTTVIVDGPDFYCAALFAFNPKICIKAAPKLERAFVGRGLEKCKAIAEAKKWLFHECPPVLG